ncbi:MAG: FG-GAP-like repeat-containing protein [Muribaculaceae bacterium]|nr:FG-GAP-like repeat-containing protein [Muribaculaceae bacterium]
MKHRLINLQAILVCLTIFATTFQIFSYNDFNHNADLNEASEVYFDSILSTLRPSLKIVKEELSSTNETQITNKKLVPATRGSSHIPKTFEIDRTKEVGEIPYNSSTTKTGAKTYEVPIDVYPGINGFQPALALSYNSQNGNSITGKGWTLSGISSIRRIPKNLYYDGMVDGVNMRWDDSFTLDGVHLIKTDTSDKSCILYESEYGHIKVKGYSTGNVQTYFEVFYPNGEKGIFGYKDSNAQQIEYPLTTMTDLDGNRIEYKYDHAEGHFRITNISYNGCSVEFSYIGREDPILMYCGGTKISESSLLKRITAKHGTFSIGSYDLSYTYVSGTALLSDITYSFGAKALNPLKFFYDDDADITEGFETSSTKLGIYYEEPPQRLKSSRGRLNYDTNEDVVIVYPKANPYYRYASSQSGYDVYFNQYPEDAKILVYSDLNGEYDLSNDPLITGNGFIDILCADLEGKMEESIVKINNYVSGNKDIVEFSVYKMVFGTFPNKAYTRTFEWGAAHKDRTGRFSVYPKFFHAGDFNGDGKTEILVISTHHPFGNNTDTSTCQVFDLEANKSLYKGCFLDYAYYFEDNQGHDKYWELYNSDRVLPIDFDGDGKTDLCHININGTDLYSFESVETGLAVSKRSTDNKLKRGTQLRNRDLFITDLNGDGLMDILLSCTNDGNWQDWEVFNSKGDGTFERKDFQGPTYPSKDNGGFLIQDINGDGIPDMIRYDNKGFSTFIAKDNQYEAKPTTTIQTDNSVLIPTNINSTNRPTQLIGISDRTATKYSYYDNNRTSTLLRGMINSLGVVEINDYGMLNDSGRLSDLYTKGYTSVYPYIDILEPFTVLSSSEVYLNGELTEHLKYKYSEGVFHKQGLGFCGFKTINRTNRRGLIEEETYDPYNYSIQKSVIGSEFEASFTYNIIIQPNKLVSIIPVSKSEKDRLKGYSATTTFVCDIYGNPTKETVEYSDGTIITLTNNYVSNPTVGDGYHLDWKSGYEKKITRNGSTYTEKLSTPSYKNRRPLKETLTKNGYTVQNITYIYDTHGNLTLQSVKPYQSTVGKTTKYTYDSKGRKLTETDHIGRKQSYTYDDTGQLKSIVDHRGGQTSFTYDMYGRESSISYPDTTVRRIQYLFNPNSSTELYSVSQTKDGEPMVRKFYDAFNREVRSSEQGLGGITKSTERRYDSYGNLWMVSEPFTGTSPSLWNVYEYDWFGRTTVEKRASGSTVKYTYGTNPHSITINDGSVIVTRKYDPFGNLISLSDPSGTVTYEVAPDGLLTSINAHDGIKTTIRYDLYRRRSGLTDPSLGNQRYSYDSAGNIVSTTNANSETIRYEYDSFQRMIKKSSNEFTTTYTYNSYGDIDSICSSNGTSKKYSYDKVGRIVSCTETGMDGMWLRKDFTYSKGVISAISYTSQYGFITTERYAYSNGCLQEVKLDYGTSIFKIEQENEYGNPTLIRTGEITRKYEYTPQGFPSKRSAHHLTISYQDVSYGFDSKTGNLLWRSDNKRNLKETFEYDQFQRLTGYDGNTATYDNMGNINGKTDIGSFAYSNALKPYALTEANLTSESIPSLTQNVTYASFSRPNTISETDNSYTFDYNEDYDRVKMTVTSDKKIISQRHYLGGCYEIEKTSRSPFYTERLYLLGDYYSSPIVLLKLSYRIEKNDALTYGTVTDSLSIHNYLMDNISDVSDSSSSVQSLMNDTYLYYILRDYLGSITHVIFLDGTPKQELSYDAWGRLRDPKTWDTYSAGEEPEPFIGRGYTGHEHLVKAGLINMNARLYDPALGRFLSPDPYVQIPDWSQNFNRYTYALNNPLVYIDEDGQFFWFAVGAAAVIGGTLNVLSNWDAITSAGVWNGVWQGTKYFMVGAAAGGVSAAVGIGAAVGFGSMLGVTATGLATASTGFVSGALSRGAAGAINGFLLDTSNSLIEGESLGTSLGNGLYGALTESVAGVICGGVEGGVRAVNNGRYFFSGKYTNRTLIQRSATFVDNLIGGSGHVAGTKKHKAAEIYLTRYQNWYENRYLDFKGFRKDEFGRKWKPDILDLKNKIIYDFKFGYPNKTPWQLNQSRQMRMYRELWGWPSVIIKP